MDFQDASRRSSEIAAVTACVRLGGTMFKDQWPGFSTPDGWRYRVAKSGTFWIAMHHELCKLGVGGWPEQAQEQALVKEF